MPTYTFINKKTNEEFTEIMTIAERDNFLATNPDYEQGVASPLVGDPIRQGIIKPDKPFRELLTKISKNNKGSQINTWS